MTPELQQQEEPILRSGVRILRPREYVRIRDAIKSIDNRTKLDTLLLTGVRYSEAERLQVHKEWFDGYSSIHLPGMVVMNSRRSSQKERWVKLSPRGIALLPYFFEAKRLPCWRGWAYNMRR